MRTIALSEENVYEGPLLLVNAGHPIRTGGHITLVPLEEDGEVYLEKKAASLLGQLFETLRCAGLIVPVSGYRSGGEQQRIYADALRDNGAAFTEKFVAAPGCSEHQTGLAVDLAQSAESIDFLRPSFPREGICGDFRSRAPKYGFIERYGEKKEALTGISHEPWHFRYVGYPHSQFMQDNNLCLEEYVAHLRFYPYRGEHLHIGDTEVFYADAGQAAAGLLLPEDCTQISGNNVDGFIVTVWRRSV
ncbi:D-alanyl-D-alanine dipeptidase/carboxypeptidase [Sporobacter termitidis DSM 10068]|uniref:D-alanyl-D-alanine dipeptidase/carboxypeptidase n=1 Tax=Sporobacter termitidis DSM 10068 TaxID=1123282 RepID=A0A1M5ZET3_9FIRM|nr:D-alanyl-D-alanine carboxypeptidase family protein [Sporobacter termitidis]SHI22738.1 D-alanyl-D-alanine dipeptidase/carboxypeptidase [Sporobacter termitidis DSM 10068]